MLRALGLRPVINACGTASQLGGSVLAPHIREAMLAAAQQFVPMAEMQERASQAIEAVIGAEAGCVASGCGACLFLAAAACMTRCDPAAMERLPDAAGLCDEIVVHRAHRNPFDHALRGAGARLIEFGYIGPGSGVGTYRWQLRAALTDKTAAAFYVDGSVEGVLPLGVFAEEAHVAGVPVIVDAAGAGPERLAKILSEGADLVAACGGKTFRGPTASGFLAGRRDLVQAATAQQQDMWVHPDFWTAPLSADSGVGLDAEPPHQGLGRTMKVGREEIAGLIVALETFAQRDFDAERRHCLNVSEAVVQAVGRSRLAKVTIAEREGWAHVTLQFPTAADARDAATSLRSGDPRIFLGTMAVTTGALYLIPTTIRDFEVEPLLDRLQATLLD